MANETKAPATLIEKLAAVMAAVERVPKNGWNDFHKYHYATEADLSDAVRSNLARYGVMLIPTVKSVEWGVLKGQRGEQRLATMTIHFTATDGKDKIEFDIMGEGADSGDKATYKAMTGATKYALLKLFLIPTGDDPEKEEDEKPAPRANGKASTDAAAKVRAAAAKPHPGIDPMPDTPEKRKAFIRDALNKRGVPGGKHAETVAEWIGRPVDKDTVLTADDFSRALAAIQMTTEAADTLNRARQNVAEAFGV